MTYRILTFSDVGYDKGKHVINCSHHNSFWRWFLLRNQRQKRIECNLRSEDAYDFGYNVGNDVGNSRRRKLLLSKIAFDVGNYLYHNSFWRRYLHCNRGQKLPGYDLGSKVAFDVRNYQDTTSEFSVGWWRGGGGGQKRISELCRITYIREEWNPIRNLFCPLILKIFQSMHQTWC